MTLTIETLHRPLPADTVSTLSSGLSPAPMFGLPLVDALDEHARELLRDTGHASIGCIACVVRYRVMHMGPGSEPIPHLAELVLTQASAMLRPHLRASDMIFALPPDTLIVLVPGAEPLETRGVVTRLDRSFSNCRIPLRHLEIELTASFASTQRSPAGFHPWDVSVLTREARARATAPSGLFQAASH